MRSDRNLPETFRDSAIWQTDPFTGAARPRMDRLLFAGPDYHRHDYSGHERNRLFLNRDGRTFTDLSPISGADTPADSRSWCRLDFDRDGWLDIAAVNANLPLLDLFRSRIGEIQAGHRGDGASSSPWHSHQFVAVRLVGGNPSPAPTTEWSNRDGIGARVSLESRPAGRAESGPALHQIREAACGEGFAAQNSRILHFGIGAADRAESLVVRWPSGRITRTQVPIPAGMLASVFENPSDSPDGAPIVLRRYGP